MHSLLRLQTFLIVVVLSIGTRLSATDAWDSPAFTTDAAILRQAAQAVQAGKHSEATVLLNELHFKFDENGKMLETRHLIYRIENQDGVKDWAETSGRWEAWHQDKPEIKARVITAEGAINWLDPKTLNDFPVHEDAPDVYSDERKYGGPLPAIAPGSIVEEEVSVRDTAPLFAAGTVHRWIFGWNVPVNKTRGGAKLGGVVRVCSDRGAIWRSRCGRENVFPRREAQDGLSRYLLRHSATTSDNVAR